MHRRGDHRETSLLDDLRRRVSAAVSDTVHDEELGGRDEHLERILRIVEKAKAIGRGARA